MKVNRNIPLDTKYNLPKEATTVHHSGKILIIAPECCNYIVLDNDVQYNFYQLLQNYTLGAALSKMNISKTDAQAVLIQIEAKKFINEKIAKVNGGFQMHMSLAPLTRRCELSNKQHYYDLMTKANCKLFK